MKLTKEKLLDLLDKAIVKANSGAVNRNFGQRERKAFRAIYNILVDIENKIHDREAPIY